MVASALLVRLLLASACLATSVSAAPMNTTAQAEAAKAARVTDILSDLDLKLRVAVKFPGAAHAVTDGQRLAPSATAEEPSVMLEGAQSDKLYALLLVDPDAPDPAAPTYRSFLHWLVVDIPGGKGEASSGLTLVRYKGAAPPTGTHRYMFLAFEQRAHSTETEIRKETPPVRLYRTHRDSLPPCSDPFLAGLYLFQERNDFNVSDWLKVTGLGAPQGFSYFLSDKAFEGQPDL